MHSLRLSNWPFSQLVDHLHFKEEREKGLERGLLQVHERQCEIQLSLLPYSSILSNKQLQLES
jgi:hypothetical protein